MHELPNSPKDWIAEIVCAYQDAAETIPFGPLVGEELTENELFHFAPLVCLKRRNIKETPKNIKVATDAALSTYVANQELHGSSLSNSIMAFSLCYIASHYALSLIDERESENILNHIETNVHEIRRQIET